MDQQIKFAILLGFLSALFIVAILWEKDKYKLWKAKRKRRRLNKKRSKLNNKGKDSKPVWPIIIFFIMLVGIPTGLFLVYKLIIMKVVSEVKEIKGFEKIPNWFWLVVAVLVLVSLLWYFRKFFSFKIPDTSKIMTSVKSQISWGNVLSILLLIGLGVFVYYQVTKPEEPGPNQTGWITTKSNDASKTRQFDLQKINEMSASSDMEFDQKEGKMLHFAPAGSDTLVYTVIKAEDYTRYWSVTAWVTNDTLFERRSDIEPYDIAKVGKSYLKVKKDCKVIVWKKVVKVVP